MTGTVMLATAAIVLLGAFIVVAESYGVGGAVKSLFAMVVLGWIVAQVVAAGGGAILGAGYRVGYTVAVWSPAAGALGGLYGGLKI